METNRFLEQRMADFFRPYKTMNSGGLHWTGIALDRVTEALRKESDANAEAKPGAESDQTQSQ